MLGAVKDRKSKGWYIKNKTFEYIVIDFFDEDNDFFVLMDCLVDMSNEKKIFVSSSEMYGMNKRDIIHLYVNPREIKSHRLQLNKLCQDSLNQGVFKNRVVCFDIYNQNTTMQWEEYLDLKTVDDKNEIRKNNMHAKICFTEETRVEIICEKDISCIRILVKQLNDLGYKIKKVSGIS